MVVVWSSVKRSRERRSRRLEMIYPKRSEREDSKDPVGLDEIDEHGWIVSGPLDCVNNVIVVVAPKISHGQRRRR